MSRIGNNPVVVPDGVEVTIDGQNVSAKGKLGLLSFKVPDFIEVSREDEGLVVKPRNDGKDAHNMWGTSRSLLNNIVEGVSVGFMKKLEIQGVGYRAQIQGKELVLQLGFSHDVNFPIPEGIEIKCPDQTHIEISGVDKQRVGQVAAVIRKYRPPEPYKGKGIRYEGEFILRKEGKKK